MIRNDCSVNGRAVLNLSLVLLLLAAAPAVSAEMEIWPDANTWPGNDMYPLGPIGGRAEVKLGWPEMRVRDLLPGCPGEKAGLALGDVIIAANGKKFEPAAEDGDKAGKGPLETLGYCIDEAEGYDGKLVLDVLRQGKPQKVTVQLQPIGAFSAKYPANCPKSQAYYDAICAHLAKVQERGGGWPGGQVTSDICALALLGRADGKYMKHVSRWADALINSIKGKEEVPGSNWMCGYDLVFLGEYYWATKDSRVPPVMTNIMEVFAKRQGNRGHFGHGTEKPFAYEDKGLIMPASACMWGFAMAEQCGVKMPDDCWEKFIAYVHQSSGIRKDVSWVGYNHSCVDTGQANGRTGNMCLALYISQRDKKWAEMMGRFLAQNKKYTLQGHTVTTLGNVSAVPALFLTDPKGYREYLDYWKWYLRLTQLPAGYACYLPNRGNIGGDYYLNQTTIVNGTIGLMLASAQGNLYMYGKFLDIEGLSYFSLTPGMQSIYTEFTRKHVTRQSIDTLKNLAEHKAGTTEDQSVAARLLTHLSAEIVAPRLDEVKASANINDLFTAKKLLDAAEKDFGDYIRTLPAYAKLDDALESATGKQQIDLGKEYFGLLEAIDRATDPKNRLYSDKNFELRCRDKLKEFSDQHGDNLYAKLARERLDGGSGRAVIKLSPPVVAAKNAPETASAPAKSAPSTPSYNDSVPLTSAPSTQATAVLKADSPAKSVATRHEPISSGSSGGSALSKNVSDKALQPWIAKVREYICAATQKGNTPHVNLSVLGGKTADMRVLSSSDKDLVVEVGGGSVPLDWSLITSRADWYNLVHAFTKAETSTDLTFRAVFLQANGRSKEAEDYFARAVVINPGEASAVRHAQESLQD